MIFKRRFREVVRRQLDLFSEENAGLLEDCHEALRRYDASSREEAGEAYEAFGDCQEELNEALHEMRDTYASTLEKDDADLYVSAFDGAAAKRLPGVWLP